jgi:ADP-ribosyl-[dinitrogen reductase] hydrolase
MNFNCFKGTIIGAALGDSSGRPFESSSNWGKCKYEGKLINTESLTRYQKWSRKAAGSVTDDTEKMICLLDTIIYNKGDYNREDMIKYYHNWVKGCFSCGRNTKYLLNAPFTMKSYEEKIKNQNKYMLENFQHPNCQSNGCLMHCSPLILFKPDIWEIDCRITNNNDISVMTNRIYLDILQDICWNGNIDLKNKILNWIEDLKDPQYSEIVKCLNQVLNKEERDLTKFKGWSIHGLYCALYGYLYFDKYYDLMYWVIRINSDTDTNACIAGAMMGAKLGYEKLYEECKNDIELIINNDTTKNTGKRPVKFRPNRLPELIEKCEKLM